MQEQTGRASCDLLSEQLAKRGILSPRTNKPYTRQNIRHIMNKVEAGRQLLEGNARSTGEQQKLSPAIIDTNHRLSAILKSIYPTAIILLPNDTSLHRKIQGREVFIFSPLPLAILSGSAQVYEYDQATDTYNVFHIKERGKGKSV